MFPTDVGMNRSVNTVELSISHVPHRCGDEPNKPYSGKLTLRISPDIHAEVVIAAATSGKSINKWVADMLDKAVHAE